MKLVVGLGNPGDRYISSRHNVGFRVALALARESGIGSFVQRFEGLYGCGRGPVAGVDAATRSTRASAEDADLGVLLPHTFMNRSGESVAAALAELPVGDLASDFAVVIDDLDLPFGRIRIRPSGGAGGHRGLESLIEHLDTRVFPRLRFGIGRPGPDEDPVNHVLSDFSRAEEAQLGERIDAAVAALETLLREGVSAAMNQFNHSPEPASAPPDA